MKNLKIIVRKNHNYILSDNLKSKSNVDLDYIIDSIMDIDQMLIHDIDRCFDIELNYYVLDVSKLNITKEDIPYLIQKTQYHTILNLFFYNILKNKIDLNIDILNHPIIIIRDITSKLQDITDFELILISLKNEYGNNINVVFRNIYDVMKISSKSDFFIKRL